MGDAGFGRNVRERAVAVVGVQQAGRHVAGHVDIDDPVQVEVGGGYAQCVASSWGKDAGLV